MIECKIETWSRRKQEFIKFDIKLPTLPSHESVITIETKHKYLSVKVKNIYFVANSSDIKLTCEEIYERLKDDED